MSPFGPGRGAKKDPTTDLRGLVSSAAQGYLLGTVPSADIATRLARQPGVSDLRHGGTLNPGAVNAMALLGTRWGYAVLFADAAKGAAACGVGRKLAGTNGAHVAGTAAVVGHCFPVWSGFRGGKGIAASCGQCLATFPVYLPADLGIAWGVGRLLGRTMPATVVASSLWVGAAALWWRRRWYNAWGPEPTAALPLAAAATSAVILSRVWAGRHAVRAIRVPQGVEAVAGEAVPA